MATNLDAYCAHCAHQIVELSGPNCDKELENRLNNALAVLQEDGVYAFYLFLKYRKLDRGPWPVWPILAELLQNPELGSPLQGNDDLAVIQMSESLHRLLLVKQLAERTLIYVRYGLRSLP